MTVDVMAAITIEREPAEVAAFAGDPSNAPLWYVNISSVSWQTERVRGGHRTADRACDAPGDDQGSAATEGHPGEA